MTVIKELRDFAGQTVVVLEFWFVYKLQRTCLPFRNWYCFARDHNSALGPKRCSSTAVGSERVESMLFCYA